MASAPVAFTKDAEHLELANHVLNEPAELGKTVIEALGLDSKGRLDGFADGQTGRGVELIKPAIAQVRHTPSLRLEMYTTLLVEGQIVGAALPASHANDLLRAVVDD